MMWKVFQSMIAKSEPEEEEDSFSDDDEWLFESFQDEEQDNAPLPTQLLEESLQLTVKEN